jgi:hypothetical protein
VVCKGIKAIEPLLRIAKLPSVFAVATTALIGSRFPGTTICSCAHPIRQTKDITLIKPILRINTLTPVNF